MQFDHFHIDEFACKCGRCGGENHIRLDFVRRLDAARKEATIPFVIISGYRCALHPESLRRPTSSHRKCAADIRAADSRSYYRILLALIGQGFTRFGFNNGSIHVDGDQSKPQEVAWTYYRT